MTRFAKLLILGLVALCIEGAVLVKNIQFKQQCAGYLKQAADASTPELALDRLDKALEYIEGHDLTEGYTSVLWKTEDENIGFWYQNLISCREELEDSLDGDQLQKSNVLMRVRETLTDEGERGTTLTVPPGISRYPYNLIWGILRLFSCAILIGIFGILCSLA